MPEQTSPKTSGACTTPPTTTTPPAAASCGCASKAAAKAAAAPTACCTSTAPDAPAPADVERGEGGRGPDRRKSAVDRRSGLERRQQSREDSGYTGPERRSGTERRVNTGLERRRGPGRRRSDERKSAEEGEMTTEQFEFVMAIQTYKKVNKKLYPTWTEILEVVRQLGYRKVMPREIKLENVPEARIYRGDAEAA